MKFNKALGIFIHSGEYLCADITFTNTNFDQTTQEKNKEKREADET